MPRFLLPRLSWNGPITASRAIQPYAARRWHPVTATSFRPAVTAEQRRVEPAPSRILHRSFHATARRSRDHHFDTLKFVQRLQSEGFTEEQSVAMMKVLNDVIEERYVIGTQVAR